MVRIKYKDGSTFRHLNPFYVNVTYQDELDAYGQFSFEYPLSDPKASKLIERVEIQIIEEGNPNIYGGYIKRIEDVVTQQNIVRRVSGVGYLEDFVNEVTLPNIAYINRKVSEILNPADPQTLIRPTTWQTIVETTNEDFTYLSSLQSSMQTFGKVGEVTGFHFRYRGTENNPRIIEFGEFGQYNGVRIRKVPTGRADAKDNILFVDEGGLTRITETGSINNYIYPLGGGGDNGINQLTLRDVDLSIVDPAYPIFVATETPNTETVYTPAIYDNVKTGPNTYKAFYLKDPTSISKYGPIKQPVTFSDIMPISSDGTTISDQDRVDAANHLYKAARWFLINHRNPHISYQFNCLGQATNLRVGDKINLRYKGVINNYDGRKTEAVYIDVDENFYVTSLSVSFGENDVKKFSLEVSNYPTAPKSDADVIQDLVQTVNDSVRQRKGSVTTYPVYLQDSFDNNYPAKFSYWIPPSTVYTDYIFMKVRIRPFRSYSTATGGGGATTQTTSGGGAVITSTSAGGATTQTSSAGGNHQHTVSVPAHVHNVPGVAHSHPIPALTVAIGLGASSGGVSRLYLADNGANGTTQLWINSNGGNICTYDGQTTNSTTPGTTSSFSGGGSFQTTNASGDHSHIVTIPDHTHVVNIGNHTHTVVLPDHTHALKYGIFEDSTVPKDVKIFIDGVDYSPQLGVFNGFNDYPNGAQDQFNILQAAAALGTLNSLLTPGIHTIEVKCSQNSGVDTRGQVQLSIYNEFYLSAR